MEVKRPAISFELFPDSVELLPGKNKYVHSFWWWVGVGVGGGVGVGVGGGGRRRG